MRHNPKALISYIANTMYKAEAHKRLKHIKSCVEIRLDDKLFFLEIFSNKNVSSGSCKTEKVCWFYFFNEIYTLKALKLLKRYYNAAFLDTSVLSLSFQRDRHIFLYCYKIFFLLIEYL